MCRGISIHSHIMMYISNKESQAADWLLSLILRLFFAPPGFSLILLTTKIIWIHWLTVSQNSSNQHGLAAGFRAQINLEQTYFGEKIQPGNAAENVDKGWFCRSTSRLTDRWSTRGAVHLLKGNPSWRRGPCRCGIITLCPQPDHR